MDMLNTMENHDVVLRPLAAGDRDEYCEVLKNAFNKWYWDHGWGQDYFRCATSDAGIFFDIYDDISHGHSVAAFDSSNGAMAGACFYHPRQYHVSLGVMSVNPDYFGQGVGKHLVRHIVDFSQANHYESLRLVGSAINMDSFSLYNRAGFVPRQSYHDMILQVPASGGSYRSALESMVRDARPDDVAAIGNLEFELSGIRRDGDYAYCIADPRDCLHASVIENRDGGIDGFMAGLRHPALNMIGPAFARSEEQMLALLARELPRFKGEVVLFVIPMDKRLLVESLYDWGARNVETHLFQVRGKFPGFKGVNLPSFLPETG